MPQSWLQGGLSVWGCRELCPVWKGLEERVLLSQPRINQPSLVLVQTTGRAGSRSLGPSPWERHLWAGPRDRSNRWLLVPWLC